jgi:hypothetical protein
MHIYLRHVLHPDKSDRLQKLELIVRFLVDVQSNFGILSQLRVGNRVLLDSAMGYSVTGTARQ